MLTTRTGNFPIGMREGWGEWQKDLPSYAAWAKASGFGHIDLGKEPNASWKALPDAGVKLLSCDLATWGALLSPDAGKRKEAVAKNLEWIKTGAALGAKAFFIVMLPEKPELKRSENFGYMLESVHALVPALEAAGAAMAIEGYPGNGALCCTPEGYRALFKEAPSKAVGINYDPSHLLRMGIDPIRFLHEFHSRVVHLHGKDTEFMPERQYEFGTEQPGTFAKNFDFGSMSWRYTIPGHGEMRWHAAFEILSANGFKGGISIELEDQNFNGTEAGEKAGFLAAGNFLAGC